MEEGCVWGVCGVGCVCVWGEQGAQTKSHGFAYRPSAGRRRGGLDADLGAEGEVPRRPALVHQLHHLCRAGHREKTPAQVEAFNRLSCPHLFMVPPAGRRAPAPPPLPRRALRKDTDTSFQSLLVSPSFRGRSAPPPPPGWPRATAGAKREAALCCKCGRGCFMLLNTGHSTI